jgi:O-acetyl-ADP-ribose deacetylase (regulator of RNase III)
MSAPFEVLVGRIEELAVDAVVNAANGRLLPGGGVDGALRQAAGPELTKHTAKLKPIGAGEAVITPGFKLKARYIIHTAAPIWSQGEEGWRVAGLAHCYMNSIKLARQHKIGAIAFPCLGTGNFGWPRGFACAIAIAACEQALADAPGVKRVIFCCFTESDAQLYRAALAE